MGNEHHHDLSIQLQCRLFLPKFRCGQSTRNVDHVRSTGKPPSLFHIFTIVYRRVPEIRNSLPSQWDKNRCYSCYNNIASPSAIWDSNIDHVEYNSILLLAPECTENIPCGIPMTLNPLFWDWNRKTCFFKILRNLVFLEKPGFPNFYP